MVPCTEYVTLAKDCTVQSKIPVRKPVSVYAERSNILGNMIDRWAITSG